MIKTVLVTIPVKMVKVKLANSKQRVWFPVDAWDDYRKAANEQVKIALEGPRP